MIDLHTHTCFSDGTDTPEELIRHAKEKGVEVIALTDHNTVGGVKRFMTAAKEQDVLGVPGIEISTEYSKKELHIIALLVKEAHFDEIEAKMLDLKRRKAEANRLLVQNLNKNGYRISYDELVKAHHNGNVNRAHIAAFLTETGQTPSIREAFSTLLKEECGLYVPPKRFDALESIAYIRSLGALPILAHPFLQFNREELEEFLPKAKAAGLMAMETEYSVYDEATTKTAREVADTYGILCSGGSDYHGGNKPYITLGKGQGNLEVSISLWEKLHSAYKSLQ